MRDTTGILVLVVSIVGILVVAIRQNLLQDAQDMVTTMKIGGHNIEYQMSPDRRRPLIVTDKEIGLRQMYPTFFNNFTRDDWDEFWDIIYGTHPLIKFDNERLLPAQRNYSTQEIQKVLVQRYPEAFTQFDEEKWKIFWKEILGIIDYKLTSLTQDDWVQKQKERSDDRLRRKIQKEDQEISDTVNVVRQEIGN
ncbi:MAG: hypothetical protein PHY46_01250 [Candidatus Omnitrophica bacterium]|nr:hypothetical protein [Candidatus Omnitrophota bacterium]